MNLIFKVNNFSEKTFSFYVALKNELTKSTKQPFHYATGQSVSVHTLRNVEGGNAYATGQSVSVPSLRNVESGDWSWLDSSQSQTCSRPPAHSTSSCAPRQVQARRTTALHSTKLTMRDLPPTPGKGWAEEYIQAMKCLQKSKISKVKKDLFGEQRLTMNKKSEPETQKDVVEELNEGLKIKQQERQKLEFKKLFGETPEKSLTSRPMSAKYRAIFGLTRKKWGFLVPQQRSKAK